MVGRNELRVAEKGCSFTNEVCKTLYPFSTAEVDSHRPWAPMASSSAKLVSRLSSIALKLNSKTASLSAASLLKSAPKSAINKRIISRLPVELSSSLDSMMPLHNAIASARLQSSLSAESQRWGLVIQGISMPL